ncbi:MAG: serine/threonine-protein kinase, partial [Bacteroidota bacterium]
SDEVGRGGMGTVYRAERSDGLFEQTVALKVVKRGMDTDAVLRRFEAERRILGRLEHPGIARVLDGGQTEDGRPWLAMEFVDGVPITDYADDHRLGVDARTDLFRQVCDAVGYAHRQLVVHRDLKPSNVLVTADGRVKLLDFGIAKLIGVEGEATQTALTQPGHVVLTPAYAAPEQILGAPISTAFDVYALGVLLYEMLSGQRPHALEDARPGSLQRMATAAAPPRPSTAVGAVQATHGTPPERVRRQLVGDLDTICLAALRKEPERRYASVDALADDLRRYREGLPVQARPDTAGYRARKFIRRHRASLAAGAASLAIISVVTVLAFIRVGAERDRAETEAQTATEVSDFLAGLFTGADPAQTSGADATARQLLAAGTARVREDLDGQPEVQSRMLHTIGTVYARLDEYTAAEDALNDALALRERVLGPDHPDVAVTQSELAFLYERQGRFPDSEQAASAAVATLRDHTDTHASPLADALHRLAFAQARLIQVEAAERHIREAVALKEELYGPRSAEVAYSMNILGDVMNYAGRLDDAERIHLAALAIREETIGTDHFHTSHTYHNLAVVYRGMEQWPEAEQFYRE